MLLCTTTYHRDTDTSYGTFVFIPAAGLFLMLPSIVFLTLFLSNPQVGTGSGGCVWPPAQPLHLLQPAGLIQATAACKLGEGAQCTLGVV